MSIINLTPSQLRHAAQIKEQIEKLQGELNHLSGGSSAPAKMAKPAKKKISAAGIAKIRAAQKARWAKIKEPKVVAASAPKPVAKKRTMSAAAKAKISEAAKARWAKIKAAKK